MERPRTFVGFSRTDIQKYHLMRAWKAHEQMDFNFTDCQLENETHAEEETYIKRKCRACIDYAGTYVMLIGKDTRDKYKYVWWEAEVALEKRCRILGVNLDGWRRINSETCPKVLWNIGAIFVPYSPHILAYALRHFSKKERGNIKYTDELYRQLGYMVSGNTAHIRLIPSPEPPSRRPF
jgi:hypothetical protein